MLADSQEACLRLASFRVMCSSEGQARFPRCRVESRRASVLFGEWLGSGRSSLEGRPGCKQCTIYKVTILGLKAIQAHMFQSGNQLGQCKAELPMGWLAHQLGRV